MNVNGSRFHLLLGATDWGACTTTASRPKRLDTLWERLLVAPDPNIPVYDESIGRLMLAPLVEAIPDTLGEKRFTATDHRDAAADRNGNLYHVADDGFGLMVRSAGSGTVTRFWPGEPTRCGPAGAFADAAAPSPEAAAIAALTVTADDFLIAAPSSGDGTVSLMRFDLVGGGSPELLELASGMRIASLAAAPDGGVWLLDTAGKRLLRADRDMRLATRPVPGETPAFGPDGAPPAAVERSEPASVGTAAAPAPVAIVTLADGSVVLLDAPDNGPAGLFFLDPGAGVLRELIRLDFAAFCIAADLSGTSPALMVGEVGGNRVRRVQLVRRNDLWQAMPEPDTLPLRRFGGRALVPIRGRVHYDSGAVDPLWVPIVEQSHRAFAPDTRFVSPIWDGAEPQCVWDRVRLDGCIPTGTSVRIEARAADDKAGLASPTATAWVAQPDFYLSRSGSELPGKRAIAMPPTDARTGTGCWELLLQGVTGRFAQLRITLAGDGRISPSLRALRLWYPRFSYVERFLPALYREEPASESFLTRFLANFEGMNTTIEDRIASAESLFDPRIAPVEMLDWLAGWFDAALDAGWDERRRRLFLQHAARFFGWRGTGRGVKLALKLALDPAIEAADFDLEAPDCSAPGAIRIVEAFRRLPSGRSFDPGSAGNALAPGSRSLDRPWLPEEGAAGLWERWKEAAGSAAPAPAARFPLHPPEGHEAGWTSLCAAQFGFVPAAGRGERMRWQAYQSSLGIDSPAPDLPVANMGPAERSAWLGFVALGSYERRLWQDHLRLRYATIDRLRAAHAASWLDFAEIPLPDQLPKSERAIRDWLIFEGQRLPMEASAHRFSVLLPRKRVDSSIDEEAALLARARRIVEIEKPAHTRFDIRFYWAMNRVGEARLGLDSAIGQGSRAPELVPGAILGRAYAGASFVGGPPVPPRGRERVAC